MIAHVFFLLLLLFCLFCFVLFCFVLFRFVSFCFVFLCFVFCCFVLCCCIFKVWCSSELDKEQNCSGNFKQRLKKFIKSEESM